jgi:hypothetical protein
MQRLADCWKTVQSSGPTRVGGVFIPVQSCTVKRSRRNLLSSSAPHPVRRR